jgi:hypothetical protein
LSSKDRSSKGRAKSINENKGFLLNVVVKVNPDELHSRIEDHEMPILSMQIDLEGISRIDMESSVIKSPNTHRAPKK